MSKWVLFAKLVVALIDLAIVVHDATHDAWAAYIARGDGSTRRAGGEVRGVINDDSCMGQAVTITIPPGPSFYIDGPEAHAVAVLDELSALLGRDERITLNRQQRHRLCVFVGDYREREEIMSRVEAWCERRGIQANREKW